MTRTDPAPGRSTTATEEPPPPAAPEAPTLPGDGIPSATGRAPSAEQRAAARIAGGLGQGFVAFSIPNYRRFWFGQVLSLVGSAMQSVSLPWLVLLLGGSPLELGIVGAMQYAPALLLAPIGGVVADRVDKRRLLLATNVVAAAEALALFALTVAGMIEIWHVIVLAVVIGVATSVEMPVRSAFIAELVPRDVLANAVSLNSVAFNTSRVIGPAVGGVAIAALGVAANFAVNAVSFAAVLIGLARIDPTLLRAGPVPERRPPLLASLGEGFIYAARLRTIRWTLILLLGMAVFGMQFTILIPLFARNVLGLGAEGYGALFGALGLGSLVGAFMLAFTVRRRFGTFVLGACAAFLACEVLLGLSRALPAVYGLAALCGFFSIVFINTINIAIQATVTDALRGRVMSLFVMVLVGSAPLGALFAGTVAELWGPAAAFIVGSALAAVVLAFAGWRLRPLWRTDVR
ncbi:MAG TPA: MFS transporter [Candidatus Limnocylindria bacterium]|nr:MFS transporter [Candidatus Limnocylindria bacterium]